MTSFRVAVKHSIASYNRQQSSFSTTSREDRPSYFRQASARSNPDPFALTDKLSRFSLEDLPVAAHPSPLPGRIGFPSPDADAVYDDDDDDVLPGEEEVITPN